LHFSQLLLVRYKMYKKLLCTKPLQYVHIVLYFTLLLLFQSPWLFNFLDSEISRYAANLTADSPQLSPAFTLCSGVRKSRRRNMIDGFTYKEPLIGR
jgi:hypothetical protein